MGAISSLFDINFSGLIPSIGALNGFLKFFAFVAVLAGPVLMLIQGYLFLKKPTPKPRKYGFHFFCGTKSPEAWKYTQQLAGLILGGLGLALTAVMLIFAIIFLIKNPGSFALTFVICMLCQAVLTLAAYVAVHVMVLKHFDKEGNPK
jgi:hypothetical protein